MVSNSQSSCLYLLSAEITGVLYYSQLPISWLWSIYHFTFPNFKYSALIYKYSVMHCWSSLTVSCFCFCFWDKIFALWPKQALNLRFSCPQPAEYLDYWSVTMPGLIVFTKYFLYGLKVALFPNSHFFNSVFVVSSSMKVIGPTLHLI
jgi:hypothetical protein